MMLRLFPAALLVLASRALGAQVTVTPVSVGTMAIGVPAAGADVAPVTNSVGTYTVKTIRNDPNVRIQAVLATPLPAGMTLAVSLAAPTGAVSSGSVILNAVTPVDVVTAIPGKTTAIGLAITYRFDAPAASGNTTPITVPVTFLLSP